LHRHYATMGTITGGSICPKTIKINRNTTSYSAINDASSVTLLTLSLEVEILRLL
jgi:hypothetical protein